MDTEHMRNCEAVEWLARFKEKAHNDGWASAREWWEKTIHDIAKHRGKAAAEDLRQRMNKVKNEKRI